MNKKSVCIITARGGSKRIPRKNIKEFCGKPIIAYSIEAALESGLFDEVMVSTDDKEIAEVARCYGASVPFMRSVEASDDHATTADAVKEVLLRYCEAGVNYTYVCCLYPTAPFVTASALKKAFSLVLQGALAVLPVTSYDYPPQRGFRIAGDESLEYAFPEFSAARSQDLPQLVHDCGQFFFAKTDFFIESGGVVGQDWKALYIDSEYVQDIDTIEDWKIAELKFRAMGLDREV